MQESFETDLTLPPVVASRLTRNRSEELVLTIAFHPQTSRIGQRVVVPVTGSGEPWIVGRRSPGFAGLAEEDPLPLRDRYISRRALQFLYQGGRLTICRLKGASRCRLGDTEIFDSVELDRDQLREGVPLLLGHSVVLLLRLGRRAQIADCLHPQTKSLHGSSACMAEFRALVSQVADSDFDVLIRGETGTGKELVAEAIHAASGRCRAPMVSINMAAIAPDLAPAALFGSARGAFTGADRESSGYFEQAAGGTLFLDEIGDVSPAVQPQLLRALQQREIQAVGGAIRRVDVRVISATDADLDAVDSAFKAALRHRLGACEIRLPALREHPEDVGELLWHFLQQTAAAEGRRGLLPTETSSPFDVAAWAGIFYSCLSYHWPGNVRELLNVARDVIVASSAAPAMSRELRQSMHKVAPDSGETVGATRRRIQDIEPAEFDRAMVASGYEPQLVARALGVSRTSVYRLIANLDGYRLVSDIPAEELRALSQECDGDSKLMATRLKVPLNALRNRLRKLPSDGR